MNFLPFFLAGYYEKDGHFFLNYGKKWNPKESKVATAILAVCIVTGFILAGELSSRKLFWGTESFNGGMYTWYTRILAWMIAFLWIWILIVWVPTKRLPVIETVGKNTLSVYLLHSIIILILMYTPLNDWLFNKIGWQLLITVGLTLGLSWNGRCV